MALTVACSFCERSGILSARIRTHYSRGTTAVAAARTTTRTRSIRRPCQQRRHQRRPNQQRCQLQQPPTTAVKSASWRHVVASYWCRADTRGSANRALCAFPIIMAAGCPVCRAEISMHGNAHLFVDRTI